MKALTEFTPENKSKIEEAIAKAETYTSGEIRVHIEDKCKEDVLDRAAFIFDNLQMEQTKERNGVLFYLAFVDHQLAILGDGGINAKVPENFWEEIKDDLVSNFKKKQYTEGLIHGIEKAGHQLAKYFPHHGDDDVDELDNEVTFGDV